MHFFSIRPIAMLSTAVFVKLVANEQTRQPFKITAATPVLPVPGAPCTIDSGSENAYEATFIWLSLNPPGTATFVGI